jgi:hypothetical protein
MAQNRLCYFKIHGSSGLALSADVSSALADKADSANVYSASAVDTLLSVKLVASDISGKANSADVTSALADKADAVAVYTKTEADNLLADKLVASDISGLAVASDITLALADKADAVNVYDKTAADALLADKLVASDISGKLDASVFNTRKGVENAFITALKDGLFVESTAGSGIEYDYTDLDL